MAMKTKNLKTILLALLTLSAFSCNNSQQMDQKAADDLAIGSADEIILNDTTIPFIGAQVFIEPGQTADEIDTWFKIMNDHHLTACRIRLFESYMRDEQFNWDFTLFDHAFKAAEKYDVKIWGTLYPVTGDNINIGGDKFPDTEEKQASIARYIKKTVNHFKSYNSLAGWVLLNEPGVRGEVPDHEHSNNRLKEWKKSQVFPRYNEKGFPVLMNFQNERFLMDYTTWFLQWISAEVRKHDNTHDLHVNNHDIFVNASEYNFPEWRKFLTSLGGSAHPSWHFTYFDRKQYAIAMSADCEMIRSGSGNLPWFMTEIQGGNNTYSGFDPICPTPEEIEQWLWITIGTEGKGAIFWTLNPRSSGVEAGEWGMVNFQNKPSDRLMAAAKVASSIENNSDFFKTAKKAESHIHILYSREALWAEKQMTIWESDFLARKNGAVIKSVMAYFEAFSEMGISPNLKEVGEFDFSKDSYKGETIVLSNQISLPSYYVKSFESFVQNGGKLIVDGLSAYFDEDMHSTLITGFDYENLFGGNVSEYKFQKDLFNLFINRQVLQAHAWKGFVLPVTGTAIIEPNGDKIGIRNTIGKGDVVWIPSLLGLGSRISNKYATLCSFLKKEASASIENNLVRFAKPHKGMIMKTLVSENLIVTILINKEQVSQNIELVFNNKVTVEKVLSGKENSVIDGSLITVYPDETIVVLWKLKQI